MRGGMVVLVVGVVITIAGIALLGIVGVGDALIITILAVLIGIVFILSGIVACFAPSPTNVSYEEPVPQIVRTQLLSVDGIKQSTRSGAVSGALVGGILAGGLGAVVGAMSNTREREHTIGHEYTFLIMYDNGTKEIETVRDVEKYRLKQLVEKMIIEGEPVPQITEQKTLSLFGAEDEDEELVCPNCGKECAPTAKKCPACGLKFDK